MCWKYGLLKIKYHPKSEYANGKYPTIWKCMIYLLWEMVTFHCHVSFHRVLTCIAQISDNFKCKHSTRSAYFESLYLKVGRLKHGVEPTPLSSHDGSQIYKQSNIYGTKGCLLANHGEEWDPPWVKRWNASRIPLGKWNEVSSSASLIPENPKGLRKPQKAGFLGFVCIVFQASMFWKTTWYVCFREVI